MTDHAGMMKEHPEAYTAFGFALAQLAGHYFPDMRSPDALPVAGSAVVLLAAAVVASVLPAARAARVDIMRRCDRSEPPVRAPDWRRESFFLPASLPLMKAPNSCHAIRD